MGTVYVLGPFRLDVQSDLLWRGTEPVALGHRAIALLRALVERPGAMISKDALIHAAWSGQMVEESNLTVQIAALRRVLGDVPPRLSICRAGCHEAREWRRSGGSADRRRANPAW
jgi:DNA-binding winged helix-turn-helix (wHTH) protein